MKKRPVLNKPFKFKRLGHGQKWEYGVADKINPDGLLFVELL